MRKARRMKEISILLSSYKRLCRLKIASGKLSGTSPEELKKSYKLTFTKFHFRPKRLMATIKNVMTPSGLKNSAYGQKIIECLK